MSQTVGALVAYEFRESENIHYKACLVFPGPLGFRSTLASKHLSQIVTFGDSKLLCLFNEQHRGLERVAEVTYKLQRHVYKSK